MKLKIDEVITVLQKEIIWCLDHPDITLNKDQQMGFVNGLRQAQSILEKAEHKVTGGKIQGREMTLDDIVKRHDELCTCSMACTDELQYCDCGQPQRVVELAQLRAALDEARKIIEQLFNASDKFIATPPADMEDYIPFGQPTNASDCRCLNAAYKDANTWLKKQKDSE
jgi:hypothetical protein